MQLCTAATLDNKEWFGVVPRHGPVIFLDAEDPESIMHWRAKKIVAHYGVRREVECRARLRP
jgi:hypothetical protein